jgi:hypothetical protein
MLLLVMLRGEGRMLGLPLIGVYDSLSLLVICNRIGSLRMLSEGL